MLALTVPDALACTCSRPGTPAEELAEADAVFEGEVTDIDIPYLSILWRGAKDLSYELLGTPEVTERDWAASERRVTFRIARAWKGSGSPGIVVGTAYGGGDCGFPFEVGDRYVVYAYEYEGFLSTSICARTSPVDMAAEDLEYLKGLPTIGGRR